MSGGKVHVGAKRQPHILVASKCGALFGFLWCPNNERSMDAEREASGSPKGGHAAHMLVAQ